MEDSARNPHPRLRQTHVEGAQGGQEGEGRTASDTDQGYSAKSSKVSQDQAGQEAQQGRRSRRRHPGGTGDRRNQRSLRARDHGIKGSRTGAQKLNTTISLTAKRGHETAEWEEATRQREADIRMGFIHTADSGGTCQDVRWDHSLHVGEQHAFTEEEQRTIIAAREAEERVLQQEDGSSEDEDSNDSVFEGEEPERPPDGIRD